MCKKTKIILGIIEIIFLIIIIFFVRKYFLLTKIMNHLAELDKLSLYEFTIENSSGFREAWLISGDINISQVHYTDLGFIVNYSAGDLKRTNDNYSISVDNRTYTKNFSRLGLGSYYGNPMTNDLYSEMSFKDKLVATLTWKIRSEKIDGQDYYYIRKNRNHTDVGHEYEFWLDKETFGKVKTTKKGDSMQNRPEEYNYYSFNFNLPDQDFSFDNYILPHLTNFKKVNEKVFWGDKAYDENGNEIIYNYDEDGNIIYDETEDLPEDDISNDSQ